MACRNGRFHRRPPICRFVQIPDGGEARGISNQSTTCGFRKKLEAVSITWLHRGTKFSLSAIIGGGIAPTGLAHDRGFGGVTDYAMTVEKTNPMPMPLWLAAETVRGFYWFMGLGL